MRRDAEKRRIEARAKLIAILLSVVERFQQVAADGAVAARDRSATS